MSIIYSKNSNQIEPAKLTDTERQTYESLPYGEDIEVNSYFTSSISFQNISSSDTIRTDIQALKNTLKEYGIYSQQYSFDNFSLSDVKIVKIPSIFYGSKIEKGTVQLDYYVTGTLVSRLEDTNQRGELRITYPSTGSIEGVVLYNHGIILLTGSTIVSSNQDYFLGFDSGLLNYSWKYFGNTNENTNSSSFDLNFKGTTYTPNIMMYMYANKGELNHSNNPTIQNTTSILTSSNSYNEDSYSSYKNVVKSPFVGDEASFKKEVYISTVNVYDKNRNLIAVAKVANPVRKPEDRDLIFKIKLDL